MVNTTSYSNLYSKKSIIETTAGIIVNISESFSELTEYSRDDVFKVPISILFVELLKSTVKFNFDKYLENSIESFIFTKSLQAREVVISTSIDVNSDIITYTIQEKPYSRLENKFPLVEKLHSENHISIGIFNVDEFILLRANQSYINIILEEINIYQNIIGIRLKDFIPGLKGEKVEAVFREIVNKKESLYLKERPGLVNSIKKYFDENLVPILEDGKVKYIICMIEDVTGKVAIRKKQIEQFDVIKDQKLQFEAVVEAMSDALIIFDKDDNYIISNKSARSMFSPLTLGKIGDGQKQAEYFELNDCLISSEDNPAMRVRKGEKLTGYILKIKAGTSIIYIEINGTPTYDKNGNFIAGILCCRDVSERYKAEKRLKEQNELLEAVIENMSDALFIMDDQGVYIKINKAGRKVFYLNEIRKYGDMYFVAKFCNFDESIIPFNDLPGNQIMNGIKISNQQIMLKYGEGKSYHSISGTPIYDNSGKFIYGVICARDITESVQNLMLITNHNEQMLQVEKEKNDMLQKAIDLKDEFLLTISHEFKTPLTVINSAIQTMELTCSNELSDKIKKYHNIIRQNSNRQLRLVNNLLDVTRMNAGRLRIDMKNVDIVLLTKSIVESIIIFAEQKGIRLSFISILESKIVGIDEEKYERILLNLLSNAVKFTPVDKSITVKLSEKTAKENNRICIQVQDKGVGIPDDKKELVFEKFGQVGSTRTKQAEGTGIGLHLVKLLVELLDGEIKLDSKLGIGSTFTIILPDKITEEAPSEQMNQKTSSSRLEQAIALEFSDVYLKN